MELDESSGNKVALPENWIELQVKEAVINISTTDRKIPQKLYLESGAFPVIDQGQSYIGGYTNDESMLVDCDLPVIIFGDHTKAVKHVNQRFAAGADGVKVLKPLSFLEQNFSFYTLLNAATRLKSKGYARHFQEFSKLKIKIPPLPEQVRIVAKLEELFSELDQGVENLRTAQQQLKVYRQALLKHAFEGKLTADWRAQNPDKLESAEALQARIQKEREARYQQQLAEWREAQQTWEAAGKTGSKPTKPKAPKVLPPLTAEALMELPELPDGWNYIYLAYLGDLGRGKSKHRPRNDPRLFGGPYPFIQTGEVKSANRVVRNYSNTYSEFGLEQSKLWPQGTLCITIAANIAETAFLGFDGCFPDSVVGLLAIEKLVHPEYVDFFIQGARARIEAYAPATAQKNINLETLENLVIPLCCGDEQKLLMQILDERFSIIDQLENTITTSLQQAEALRQSILKKAFSGQLVLQHPDDEPASVLLERISSERTAQQPARKRGRKVATSV
ncbi:restriction endonuclease subunit S [Aeromonas jandaei]|uniref:restriction endonuclease subunit S n=1 Tax=Aeromonas jandaei TaxID=650 RepID=UPI00214BFF2E|nr:restriction endonuclease subunit S [Aeromonas jandaei]